MNKEQTLYKLTDAIGWTRAGMDNPMKWGENVTHEVTIPGTEICTNQVIHVYEDPLQAVIFNSRHANFTDPILWEARGKIVVHTYGKCGVKRLKTVKKLEW